jgi:hypothetical protein
MCCGGRKTDKPAITKELKEQLVTSCVKCASKVRFRRARGANGNQYLAYCTKCGWTEWEKK